jgi:hypothetical protein
VVAPIASAIRSNNSNILPADLALIEVDGDDRLAMIGKEGLPAFSRTTASSEAFQTGGYRSFKTRIVTGS